MPSRRSGLAALAALVMAGCGDDSRPAAVGVGELKAGSVAPLAQCRDWTDGDAARRQATVEDIRRQINLRDTPTPTPTLTDAQAHAAFERACAEKYAAGFRLYVIYARAAAFQSLPGS